MTQGSLGEGLLKERFTGGYFHYNGMTKGQIKQRYTGNIAKAQIQ